MSDLEGSVERHQNTADNPLDMDSVTNFLQVVCEALPYRHLNPKTVAATCEKLVENHDDALAAALLSSKSTRSSVLSKFCKEKTSFCPATSSKKKAKKSKKRKKGAPKKAEL